MACVNGQMQWIVRYDGPRDTDEKMVELANKVLSHFHERVIDYAKDEFGSQQPPKPTLLSVHAGSLVAVFAISLTLIAVTQIMAAYGYISRSHAQLWMNAGIGAAAGAGLVAAVVAGGGAGAASGVLAGPPGIVLGAVGGALFGLLVYVIGK